MWALQHSCCLLMFSFFIVFFFSLSPISFYNIFKLLLHFMRFGSERVRSCHMHHCARGHVQAAARHKSDDRWEVGRPFPSVYGCLTYRHRHPRRLPVSSTSLILWKANFSYLKKKLIMSRSSFLTSYSCPVHILLTRPLPKQLKTGFVRESTATRSYQYKAWEPNINSTET